MLKKKQLCKRYSIISSCLNKTFFQMPDHRFYERDIWENKKCKLSRSPEYFHYIIYVAEMVNCPKFVLQKLTPLPFPCVEKQNSSSLWHNGTEFWSFQNLTLPVLKHIEKQYSLYSLVEISNLWRINYFTKPFNFFSHSIADILLKLTWKIDWKRLWCVFRKLFWNF